MAVVVFTESANAPVLLDRKFRPENNKVSKATMAINRAATETDDADFITYRLKTPSRYAIHIGASKKGTRKK